MSADIQNGLLALHGNRSEVLAEAVLSWLQQRPLAPLEEEVILVQSAGMAEWLKMTLASAGGVCAATRVELPARFMWRTFRQVLGRDEVPAQSVTDKTPLTWRLMHLLPQWLHEPGFESVTAFLQGREPDRLYQLATRLADLFDQYQVYRADWMEAWAKGQDVLLCPGRADQPVPPEQLWQPRLWRALLATLKREEIEGIRPRVLQRVVDALDAGQVPVSPVARRVIVFGMTSIPLSTLDLLASLSEHSQVIFAIPNPCRFHWADIMDGRDLLRSIVRRRHSLRANVELSAVPLEHMHAHAHPLLAAWGRQSRDFVRQLDEFDDVQRSQKHFALPRVDLFEEGAVTEGPMLAQVQHCIRDLLPLQEHPGAEIAEGDRSIVFNVAHSMMREVEVLHDHLLRLFAESSHTDRPVQPRDVVVMVPNIDDAAAAIRAVFGQYGRHDPRHIPFDIADLSARASSPLVAAVEWVLRLPQQRCRFSELRDLLDVPAIAARFGISPTQLPQLTHWMAGAGIRWGLDASHRHDLGLDACGDQNSGWFGLRRMLLGYAAGEAVFDGIEAYSEIGGLEAELAGSLAGLLTRLTHWNGVLKQDATPLEWAERGRALLQDLTQPQDERERLIIQALEDALQTWLDACAQAQFDAPICLHVAREAWLAALDEPTLNKRFKAGGVTFCTLMPMRAIPFEVVGLLGMNDGDYPRRAVRTDFDLMLQPGTNRPGDRSRRDDDRQLMLEALLSARQQLYVSWTGRNVRDNAEQPPSVLVSQLRDYLAAVWGQAVVDARTTVHPLQPFSRRYFELGSPLFTYAREWHGAHEAVLADAPEMGETEALPPYQPDVAVPLTMNQLAQFLRHPVEAFFKQRLNVSFPRAEEEPEDEETFALEGLAAHQMVSTLMDGVMAEIDEHGAGGDVQLAVTQHLSRLHRAGELPMGAMGQWTQDGLASTLLPMLAAWLTALSEHREPAPRQPLEQRVGEVLVQDWADQMRWPNDEGGGDGVPVWLHLSASKLAVIKRNRDEPPVPRLDKLRLAWVRSVLTAACGVQARAVLIGSDASVHCEPMSAEMAADHLAALIQVWCQGMNQPLPLPMRSAIAHVQEPGSEVDVYEGGFQRSAEADDPYWLRMYPDFDALIAPRAEAGEGGLALFESLSHQLWGRVLDWASTHVSVVVHESASKQELAA